MTPTQQAKASAHIFKLCEKHSITMRRAKSWSRSVAFPNTRIIYFPPRILRPTPMTDIIDYLISLHEIGHVVDRRATKLFAFDDQTSTIMCEAAAWAWAYRNVDQGACPVISRHARAVIAGLWSTYLPSRPNRESA